MVAWLHIADDLHHQPPVPAAPAPGSNVGASKPKLSSISLASACSTGIVNGVVEGVVNGVVNGLDNGDVNGVVTGVVNGAGAVARFDAADVAVSLALVVASSAQWTRRLLRCRGLMPAVAFIRFARMVVDFAGVRLLDWDCEWGC